MPLSLTPLCGQEFITKVLQGERDFRQIQLERSFDFTAAEGYSSLLRYLERNSRQKLLLTDSELRHIRAPGMLLPRLDGERVNLESSYLVEAQFEEADLSQFCFRGADLTGAHFGGAQLSQAILEQAVLVNSYMDGADLAEANLKKARLHGSSWEEASLSRADLRGVRGLEYCQHLESVTWEETVVSSKERDCLRRILEKGRFVVRE
ncbi:MAG: pentapeptide repeat-containing protein [Nanoarchaeota archaeon]